MVESVLLAECPVCMNYLKFEKCDIHLSHIKQKDGSMLEVPTIKCPVCGFAVIVHRPCGI